MNGRTMAGLDVTIVKADSAVPATVGGIMVG
jgi:hypothetical protein